MGLNHLSQLSEQQLDTLDRRERYKARAILKAQIDPGPWLSSTILVDSRKRANKNHWAYDIDRDYLVSLWHQQHGCCDISGVPMQAKSGTREDKNPFRASLDRIDNARGYVRGNVRFVCHWVNNAKSTWSDEVFDLFVDSIMQKMHGMTT